MSRAATAGRPAIPGLRHVCESIIYQHVFSNAEREVGGVLVGRISHEGGMPTVTGAIPAIAADEQRAALTFTQDSWEHVHRVLDRDYPEERIVGWYHSHPAFGIFLSGHDLFIHRNFFSSQSQIALVIDPIAREEGVFAWRRSKSDVDLYTQRPTPAGWYALAKDGTALPARPGEEPSEGKKKPRRPPYPLALIVLAALAGFAAAFVISFLALRHGSAARKQPAATTTTGSATRSRMSPAVPTSAGGPTP